MARPLKEIEPRILTKIAKLFMRKETIGKIVEETGISEEIIYRLYRGNEMVKEAQHECRMEALKLVDDALRALKNQLQKKDSIEAAKVVFTLAGAMKQEEVKDSNQQSLTVILPSSIKEVPVLEVKDAKDQSFSPESN